MPQMDGLEFIKKLRRVPAYTHLPVVVMTAELGPFQKIEGGKVSVSDWAQSRCFVIGSSMRLRVLLYNKCDPVGTFLKSYPKSITESGSACSLTNAKFTFSSFSGCILKEVLHL
jgi:hypothetical protein